MKIKLSTDRRRLLKELAIIIILILDLYFLQAAVKDVSLLRATLYVMILMILLLYIFMPRVWFSIESDRASSFYWFRVVILELVIKILIIYAAWLFIWFVFYFLTNGIDRTSHDLAKVINNEMKLSNSSLEIKAERAIAGKVRDIKRELCSNYFSCTIAAISISDLILNDVPALWRLLELLEDPCTSGKSKPFSYLCNISNYQQVFVLLRIKRTASDEYMDVVVKRKNAAKNLNQILGF